MHYRKLAAEEVAMAKVALTNEARARHYAKAAEIGSSRMQSRTDLTPNERACGGKRVDLRPNWKERPECRAIKRAFGVG